MNGSNPLSSDTAEALMAAAEEARGRAYAPYSGFSVGAAILFGDGRVVTGCNVENASYSLSICAERNAMSTAVAMGLTRPVAIAVAGPDGVFCPPCGACRQFLAEFSGGMPVIIKGEGGITSIALNELLPSGFSLKGE
ncbi:cytidine deaminase [Cloacibacillus sp. An23]|uniref:cytidine deaminase n=1 Tax=Cloacibacillus sp. An23 TaxID=1965591 RepID=UPI000B3AA8C0|nr:cytidine deaminase [Cloacibacillus sp. An23]OUO94693.1 cytidine deaminase [Cloacibacillus sp. An23]